GAQLPQAEWGSMGADGTQYFPWGGIGTFPGLALFTVGVAFNFLGDTPRGGFDPRTRLPQGSEGNAVGPPRRPAPCPGRRARGRKAQYSNTGPESTVPRAPSAGSTQPAAISQAPAEPGRSSRLRRAYGSRPAGAGAGAGRA